jgi:hypothetical protein
VAADLAQGRGGLRARMAGGGLRVEKSRRAEQRLWTPTLTTYRVVEIDIDFLSYLFVSVNPYDLHPFPSVVVPFRFLLPFWMMNCCGSDFLGTFRSVFHRWAEPNVQRSSHNQTTARWHGTAIRPPTTGRAQAQRSSRTHGFCASQPIPPNLTQSRLALVVSIPPPPPVR